jgi:membrane protein YqaA with SNARE-associated domain
MFFLTHSKFFLRFSFFLTWLLYCMSMIFFLSAYHRESFLSFCSLFAVAKVIIYFFLTKCFEGKF